MKKIVILFLTLFKLNRAALSVFLTLFSSMCGGSSSVSRAELPKCMSLSPRPLDWGTIRLNWKKGIRHVLLTWPFHSVWRCTRARETRLGITRFRPIWQWLGHTAKSVLSDTERIRPGRTMTYSCDEIHHNLRAEYHTHSDVRHEKTDLKVFVVVITKEGWACLVWHWLFENIVYDVSQILKSRCHTKIRMGAAMRAHPSFGMTTTNTLRYVFLWRASYVLNIMSLFRFWSVRTINHKIEKYPRRLHWWSGCLQGAHTECRWCRCNRGGSRGLTY